MNHEYFPLYCTRHKDNVELGFLNSDLVLTWFMGDLSEIYWSFHCLSEKKNILLLLHDIWRHSSIIYDSQEQ